MKQTIQRVLLLMLSLSCLSATALAADTKQNSHTNTHDIEFIASANETEFEASKDDNTVTVTIRASEQYRASGINFTVDLPDGWTLMGDPVVADDAKAFITMPFYNADASVFSAIGMNSGMATGIAQFTAVVPVDAPKGTYSIGIRGLTLANADSDKYPDWAAEWETGGAAYAQVTLMEKAQKPTANFTATGADVGVLSGVENGLAYKIGNGEYKDVTSSENVTLTGLTAGEIAVIRKGNAQDYTKDSDEQIIAVTKAETPTLEAGEDSIPTTAEHQYSMDGENWQDCTGALNDLKEGTYYVRVKAHDNVLASEAQEIMISRLNVTAHCIKPENYTVNGRKVTVVNSNGLIYRMGYLDADTGKYVLLPSSLEGGERIFNVPVGVKEAIMVVKGDTDQTGSIGLNDATFALRATASVQLGELNKFAADLDNDGRISMNDATFILRATASVKLDWDTAK